MNPPRRHFGVFLLADEVDLGRPDIGVAGGLAHLVRVWQRFATNWATDHRALPIAAVESGSPSR
jgi:hypothetical protein